MAIKEVKVQAGYFDWREATDAEGNYTSAEVPYFVFNVEDEASALAAVRDEAPAQIGRLYLREVSIEERMTEEVYKVMATYCVDEQKERADGDDAESGNSDPALAFDTTGGTRHLNRSLATISITPAEATNYGGAIEVDGEGNVNGVDVTMPVMTFSETHTFAQSKVTTAYRKQLFLLTGTVNKAAFRDFDIGEVLFLGASGQKDGEFWDITFKFAVSPNRTNLKVTESLIVPSKYGWDYLWVKFGEKVVNGAIVKEPIAAYVERVYEAGDFSKLKLAKAQTQTA